MTGQAPSAGRRPKKALAVVSGAIVFLILIGLGTWQVQRLHWKEGLLATIAGRMAEPPVDLLADLEANPDVASQEYRPVTVEGVFDHRFERHFLATFKGQSGFNIYTPLRLDDGDWVFVNRGFVPYDRKDPSTRRQGQVQGRVKISGLLRPILIEKPSSLVPENEPAKNIFYWKDIGAMDSSSGLPADAKVLDLFVDAGDAPNPGGLPVGGTTIVDLPNNHLQYAVTWYGLAAALAGVLIAWLVRQRKPA